LLIALGQENNLGLTQRATPIKEQGEFLDLVFHTNSLNRSSLPVDLADLRLGKPAYASKNQCRSWLQNIATAKGYA
jgi:hypothetical protein